MALRDLKRRPTPASPVASGRLDAARWEDADAVADWRRPPAGVRPARRRARTDFFGVDLDGSQVPDAIAIRSTALDEGRARDLRRANAFRAAEGRPKWQLSVYESAFASAWSGDVTAQDDAALDEFERLYPDPDAVLMARAHGPEENPEADALAIEHIPESAPEVVRARGMASWGGIVLSEDRDVGNEIPDRPRREAAGMPMPPETTTAPTPTPTPTPDVERDPTPSVTERMAARERAEAESLATRVKAALSALLERRMEERRRGMALGIMSGIRDDVAGLLAAGIEADEIEQAVLDGGFALPPGWRDLVEGA